MQHRSGWTSSFCKCHVGHSVGTLIFSQSLLWPKSQHLINPLEPPRVCLSSGTGLWLLGGDLGCHDLDLPGFSFIPLRALCVSAVVGDSSVLAVFACCACICPGVWVEKIEHKEWGGANTPRPAPASSLLQSTEFLLNVWPVILYIVLRQKMPEKLTLPWLYNLSP